MIDREYAKECVGKGWSKLIDEAYDTLEKYGVPVSGVKEKWAGLRIDASFYKKTVERVLDDIEQRSFHICEFCGKEGRPQDVGGWIKTICYKCLKKHLDEHPLNLPKPSKPASSK